MVSHVLTIIKVVECHCFNGGFGLKVRLCVMHNKHISAVCYRGYLFTCSFSIFRVELY